MTDQRSCKRGQVRLFFVWDEQSQEEVKLDSPIVRWKKLCGDKDPAVAKGEEPLPGPKVVNEETKEETQTK